MEKCMSPVYTASPLLREHSIQTDIYASRPATLCAVCLVLYAWCVKHMSEDCCL